MTLFDVLAFFLLLVGSAFFSGTETALTAVSEGRLLSLAEQGDRRARIALEMIRERGRTIGGLLIGNNIVNTLLAVFAANIFNNLIPAGSAPPWVAPAIASVLSIFFLLIGGEVIPKNLGLAFQTQWSLLAAVPCRTFLFIVSPLVWLLNLMNRALLKLLGKDTGKPSASIDDLMAMIKLGHKIGVIDPMELELVRRAMFMNETMAREIMTPRVNMCGVAETASRSEIQAKFDAEQYSRMPVYAGGADQIAGILHYKELQAHRNDKEFDLKKLLLPPLFFPETVAIGKILDGMRQSRNHMAILVDEFGGTAGLVTLEDIIEQIFGDISDEHDGTAAPRFQWTGPESFDAVGRLAIAEVQQQLADKKLPLLPQCEIEEIDTLAGLAQKLLGASPAMGASAVVGRYRVRVKKIRGREIVALSVSLNRQTDGDTGGQQPTAVN